MKLKNRWITIAAGCFTVGLLTGCASNLSTGIKVKSHSTAAYTGKVVAMGSTALLPLVQAAAQSFQQKYPNSTVSVSGGGSFTGLNQVESGAVNIGNSDVYALKNQKNLIDHIVAIVPFVMAVNKDVSISNLSQVNAVKIFTGQITNWKQVGGQNMPITLINRPTSSGTRATFKKIVLQGKNYSTLESVADSNEAVMLAISKTAGAIGVIGAAYANHSIKTIRYNGVAYTPQNVKEKKYKIYSYEHMYTKGKGSQLARAFIRYIQSPLIQKTDVPELKFLPIS